MPSTFGERLRNARDTIAFRSRRYYEKHAIELTVLSLILLFLVVFFAKSMFIVIPAGHVGVVWRLIGGTDPCPRGEGLHVIMPWNRIYDYDTQVQMGNQHLDVLSSDGLDLQIDVAYRFELVRASVPSLHEFVGPNYMQTLVGPEVASDARNVFSKNTPEEIWRTNRIQIQGEIRDAVNAHLLVAFNPPAGEVHTCNTRSPLGWIGGAFSQTAATAAPATPVPGASVAASPAPASAAPASAAPVVAAAPAPGATATPPPTQFVNVEDILTRSITLPPSVETAINSKNEQQQLDQEYDFRILREEKEAKRKRIEASGIADFETILSKNMPAGWVNNYLRLRGIDATLELARSTNAKVVIIGGSSGNMPIILGDSTSPGIGAGEPRAVARVPVPPDEIGESPQDALQRQLDAAAPVNQLPPAAK